MQYSDSEDLIFQHQQVHHFWKMMTNDLKEVVNNMIPDSIAKLFIHSMMSFLEK